MGILSFLSGKEAIKETIKGIGSGVSNVLDRVIPKKLSGAEKIAAYAKLFGISEQSTTDARKMFMVEMQTQKQPWLIRMLNGLVRPFGGIGALATEFFCIWGANLGRWFGFDFAPITLNIEQHLFLGSICAFYFGSRLKETLSGISTKR